jgi:hypothetical protein
LKRKDERKLYCTGRRGYLQQRERQIGSKKKKRKGRRVMNMKKLNPLSSSLLLFHL